MTIDERIEALTQSLELLASMHRDEEQRGDERFTQLTEMAKINDERFAQVGERFAQVTHNFEIVLDSIKRLERIALAHEDRIDDHQDRIEGLEDPQ